MSGLSRPRRYGVIDFEVQTGWLDPDDIDYLIRVREKGVSNIAWSEAMPMSLCRVFAGPSEHAERSWEQDDVYVIDAYRENSVHFRDEQIAARARERAARAERIRLAEAEERQRSQRERRRWLRRQRKADQEWTDMIRGYRGRRPAC
jgi:hypothetical protein